MMSGGRGRDPKNLALLVGSPRGELGNVAECIGAMRGLLVERGFEITEVQDASFERIDAAMKRILGTVISGDAVVFYYAGHGYRLFDKEGRFPTIPMLVPMDVHLSEEGSSKVLAGFDVHRWLESIAQRVAVDGRANVTAILECCHAADLLSDIDESEERVAALRAYMAKVVGERARGEKRSAGDVSQVVRVVAAAAAQSAFGHESGTVGLMTEALVGALRAQPREAWGSIEHRLRAQVHAQGRTQWPGVEGPRERLPFSLETPPPAPALVPFEWVGGDLLRCDLAPLFGVRPGDLYELRTSPSHGPWGTAEVVDPLYLRSHHPRPAERSLLMWARRTRVAAGHRVELRPAEGWGELSSAFDEMGLQSDDAGAEVIATVEHGDSSVEVLGREGSILGRWDRRSVPDVLACVMRSIDRARLLELAVDPKRCIEEEFELRWGRYDAWGEPDELAIVPLNGEDAPPTVPAEDPIWVELDNRSPFRLHCSVFRVDADHRIELLTSESASGLTVPRRSKGTVGEGTIVLDPRGGPDELLLVVVSPEPISLHMVVEQSRDRDWGRATGVEQLRAAGDEQKRVPWTIRTITYRLSPYARPRGLDAAPAATGGPSTGSADVGRIRSGRPCGCDGAGAGGHSVAELHEIIAALRARNEDLTRALEQLGRSRRTSHPATLRSEEDGKEDGKEIREADVQRALRDVTGGCSEPDAATTLALRIVGGHRIGPEDSPSCVAVGNRGGWYCSGVVIAPRLVLTAKHCGRATRIMTGSDDVEHRPGQEISVVDVIAHDTVDLALLVLGEDAGVEPVPIGSEEDLGCLREVSLVGYGRADVWARTRFGVKRSVDVPVLPVSGCDPETMTRWADDFGYDLETEMVGGRKHLGDSCKGDSGGPVYASTVTGRQLLVGVTSRATKGNRRPCGAGGVYVLPTRVEAWIDEHRRTLPADAPAAPPAVEQSARAGWRAELERRARRVREDIRRLGGALEHDARYAFIAPQQVETLLAPLAELGTELDRSLAQGQTDAGWARTLIEQATGAERLWQAVRWVLAQRSDASLGYGLQLADLAMTSAVKHLGSMRGFLASKEFRPIVVSEAIDSPAAVRGRDWIDGPGIVAGSKDPTRLGSRLDLVLVPPGDLASPWWFVLLFHELGHTLDARLDVSAKVWDALPIVDRNRLGARSRRDPITHEIAADLIGVALGGSAFAEALEQMLHQRGSAVTDEDHPPANARVSFVLRQVQALRGEGPADVIHAVLEELGLSSLRDEWVAQDERNRELGRRPQIEDAASEDLELDWHHLPAVAWHAMKQGIDSEQAPDDVLERLIALGERIVLPSWARDDNGWQFVRRTLPQLREANREGNVKDLSPDIVDYEHLAFVGATHKRLAKWLTDAFPLRRGRKWPRIEIYVLSDAGLDAMAKAGSPQSLEKRHDAITSLEECLPDLAETWTIRQYDFPFHFASFHDWFIRGGRIHTSVALYDANIDTTPSMDYLWLLEEPSPEYQAYWKSFHRLRERSQHLAGAKELMKTRESPES